MCMTTLVLLQISPIGSTCSSAAGGVFGGAQEPGDLNYGAVALLAVTVSVLESLVGEGGLWLEKVPDLDLLHYMQYMVFFGHSLLLPSWVMVVLRSFWVI
jgi:hypothetical protein